MRDDVFLGPSCVFTNVRQSPERGDRRGSMFNAYREGDLPTGLRYLVCGNPIGSIAFVGAGAGSPTPSRLTLWWLETRPGRQDDERVRSSLLFYANGTAVSPEADRILYCIRHRIRAD